MTPPASGSCKLAPGRKAQVSVEFMMIFLVLIAALSVVIIASMQNTDQMKAMGEENRARQVLESAADRIDTVFIEGHGFSANLTLPETISGQSYYLGMASNSIELLLGSGQKYYFRNLLTENVTGNFSPGIRTLANVNGVVVVS